MHSALAGDMGTPGTICPSMGSTRNPAGLWVNDRDAGAAQSSALCVCRLPVVVGKHYERSVQHQPRSPMSAAHCSGKTAALVYCKCNLEWIQVHR